MTRRLALAFALALALALSACASAPSGTGSRPSSPPPPPKKAGLQEQASWLKGSDAKLTPIPDAQAWLRSADYEAYRDASGAECIYDRARERVLTWEPGVHTVSPGRADTWQPDGYGVAVGVAAEKADAAARLEFAGDLASMRRAAQVTDQGTEPEYSFNYDRYVDGIRIPDHVTVTSSGKTGDVSFVAHFTKPSTIASGYAVAVDLPTAVANAAKAAKLTSWRFLAAELYVVPALGASSEDVTWSITLQDTSEPAAGTAQADGDVRIVLVDPATGAAAVEPDGGMTPAATSTP